MAVAPRGYQSLATLGVGVVSTTFEVVCDGERDVLVCKRLSPRFVADPQAVAMLAREARILSLLAGRGAPRLAFAGQDEHGPFFVTERAPGVPLRSYSPGPSDGDLRAAWSRAAEHAFAALARVHEATGEAGPLGVVHGDLSPDNVLVTHGAATLVDFGLASFAEAPAFVAGPFRGTLRYVAPEVARGEAFDARADLFALAASILHASSGKAPREGSSAAAILASAGQEPVDAYARSAGGSLLPEHAQALARCLAFHAQDRPRRAQDVFPPGSC